MHVFLRRSLLPVLFTAAVIQTKAQQITAAGQPAELNIRQATPASIRVTLKPLGYTGDFPFTPALVEKKYPAPAITICSLDKPIKKQVGNLTVEIKPNPLTITITNSKGEPVQELRFLDDGRLAFRLDTQPVLGMGEGGPKPERGVNWRQQPIQFDRRGMMDSMQPRWQADAYGSRNPVALLLGTAGWGLFVATPWVLVDMQHKDQGYFIPWQPTASVNAPQTARNQQLNQGKGIHPAEKRVEGLYDFFVFDAHDPAVYMKDFSSITGPAAMPPKWALGYMQSHRTLIDEKQMLGIVDTFRNKQIPVDAVIYLGTGFAPVGWNKKQPSFEFNPEVFHREPAQFVKDMHDKQVKLILHMVPFDRDKLPSLQGSIPAKAGEPDDASHIRNYWQYHVPLVNAGVDGFWPDEGDWFNLFERIKRHQLYYQGMLSTRPNIRPWSLQRNGYPGIAQWGGWVWSGDTESSWKTLEGQVAVGINYSLSIGPYWGSDIGGFYSNTELTGELYARWFQFASFCGSFRSHGRTWRTRLPWGWGLSYMGPSEDRITPLMSELNNPAIEPIARKYDELHYQLLPYTYTLAWEARNTGMPLMRALWLHYAHDKQASAMGSQYLWGRDMLVAPVFKKGVTSWDVYLPEGNDWYDWWTNEKKSGGQTVHRAVDLATMPVYVKAGAIIPFDPVRQHTAETVKEPTMLKVFSGANGSFTLYEDDGISQDYLKGIASLTTIAWNDTDKKLTLTPSGKQGNTPRVFKLQLLPAGTIKEIRYAGKPVTIQF
ncbi:glycoside hydrolase family 31 protein [Sediminibacterium soli]|uniref:glycoside hydrolase family 31 protein n=1 Tax=Sediminibacterium soli TaxID=2698829 RepID=UPI0013796725|nr:TIM-barrel domain-containing protein [Sediminibacterium soli]NCI45191.1 glycoside hydrolase family 31 protein [Sediminibacterium soli]